MNTSATCPMNFFITRHVYNYSAVYSSNTIVRCAHSLVISEHTMVLHDTCTPAFSSDDPRVRNLVVSKSITAGLCYHIRCSYFNTAVFDTRVLLGLQYPGVTPRVICQFSWSPTFIP